MAMVIDPICGMRIEADDAAATAEHDGQIVFSEFRSLVRELDPQISDSILRIGFEETDVDHNGHINIDEFRAWWLSA